MYIMCHELWHLFCFALISLQWRYMCSITDNLTVYNLSLRLTLKLRILSLCDGHWWITVTKGGQLCQKAVPWHCVTHCCGYMITSNFITMTSHERHVVSNHQSFNCLFGKLCGRTSNNIEVHVTAPLWREFTDYRWFLAQTASNAEKASILWRHHVDPYEISRPIRHNNAFDALSIINH